MSATLLVVAKAPVPGRAKTRLAATLGPDRAAHLAAAALLDTIEVVAEAAGALGVGRPVVAWDGDAAEGVRAEEVTRALSGCHVVAQPVASFADRLVAAHRDAAAVSPVGGVVQIGMDTPQVTVGHLVLATEALRRAPAALGDAEDGGWWVLAVREAWHAEPLREVPMSQPDTALRTRAALARRGIEVASLPVLRDVNTWEDARAVAPHAGPRFRQTVRHYEHTAHAGR